MPQIVIYLLMGFVIFLIVFLTIRFILQMIFIRECPNCGRNVSLAVSKTCSKCGYVFLKERYTKLNWTIAILATAVILIGYCDVKAFREETAAYVQANPRLQELEAVDDTEAESLTGTEAVTETEIMNDTETTPAEEQMAPEAAGEEQTAPEAAGEEQTVPEDGAAAEPEAGQ